MAKKDYYEVLGVSKTATVDEIKSAFKKLAKKYHPDVSKEPDAEAKFKEVQEAYAVLSDADRRRKYDQFGHDAFKNTSSGGNPQGGYDFSGFDFSDIFDNIFGGSSFGGSFGFGGGPRREENIKGKDVLVNIKLSFMEAVLGCGKNIELSMHDTCKDCHGAGGFGEETCNVCHGSGTITSEQRTIFGSFLTKTTCNNCGGTGKTYKETCSTCRGAGRIKTKKEISVTIPEGVDTGNRLRITGKGEVSKKGIPGDLYLEFEVSDHDFYQRDENDIYMELPITIKEAILGCKKTIKTLHGSIILTVPSGSETGDKHRLKGKGIKDVNQSFYGDMYIVIKVIIPQKLSRNQKQLLDELDNDDLKTKEIEKNERFNEN
ncbi:MAG TPA: molecular chaperone DnaJ [Bacilli bacterium]|nr:molecular chaperone DnaJ [Bacilli bacterium]